MMPGISDARNMGWGGQKFLGHGHERVEPGRHLEAAFHARITLDVLSAEGEFLGGNISPGVEMRLKAMHHFTARLPLVARSAKLGDDLGDSTESAIRNGGEFV